MRTLICDDDVHMRRLYRLEFELAGVEVIEASNGPECVELVQREHPDLVVLDLNMPRGVAFLPCRSFASTAGISRSS